MAGLPGYPPSPMSGEPLFRAVAELRVPDDDSLESFRERLDELSAALGVDLQLSDEIA